MSAVLLLEMARRLQSVGDELAWLFAVLFFVTLFALIYSALQALSYRKKYLCMNKAYAQLQHTLDAASLRRSDRERPRAEARKSSSLSLEKPPAPPPPPLPATHSESASAPQRDSGSNSIISGSSAENPSAARLPSSYGTRQLCFTKSEQELRPPVPAVKPKGVTLTREAIRKGLVLNSESSRRSAPKTAVCRRSVTERIQKPYTADEFEAAMVSTTRFILEYAGDADRRPVTTDLPPWTLVKCLPKNAPNIPEEFDKVLDDVKNFILPMLTHWQHPRFLAYFANGRHPTDILSAAVEAALGVVGFNYDACPALTELEVVVTNWLAAAFGLPRGFCWDAGDVAGSRGAGLFLPSASDAVFSVVMAARDWKFERVQRKFYAGRMDHRVNREAHLSAQHDIRHEICQRMVVYASKDAHSCLEKACKMAMVRCHPIQATAETDWGITGEQLEAAMKKDLEFGLVPFLVHVTLGTTSTAASDDLKTIWPIARKYKLWLHVDAAYAGGAWVVKKYRENAAGLEHATSLNVNLNKFFMHVTPGAVLWMQDKETFRRAFAINPSYLVPQHSQTIDLRDYGVQLTRTFRSLRAWFLLRTAGIEGLRYYVNHAVTMATALETQLLKHANVRPFCKRVLALFCFQYFEPELDFDATNKATRHLADYINRSHQVFITRANVGGHDIIRVSVNYIEMTQEHVRDCVAVLHRLIDAYRQTRSMAADSAESPAPLEGRGTRPGPGTYDVDLKEPPPQKQSEVAGATERWAETPTPITLETSLDNVYSMPGTPLEDIGRRASTTRTARACASEPIVGEEEATQRPDKGPGPAPAEDTRTARVASSTALPPAKPPAELPKTNASGEAVKTASAEDAKVKPAAAPAPK